MKTIILVGFRGVGKTECGKTLAKILNWEFIDTDENIKLGGKTIESFSAEFGMDEFRRCELLAIQESLARAEKISGCVLAMGGGFVDSVESKAALNTWLSSQRETAKIVWVKAKLPTIETRLQEGPVRAGGNLSPDELASLLHKRAPAYERIANFEFDNDQNGYIAERLKDWLRGLQAYDL